MDTAGLTTPKPITAAEHLEMGDIGPCQLLRGEMIDQRYAHAGKGYLVSTIGSLVGDFVSKRKLGWVLMGGVAVFTEHQPDTVHTADMVFISRERAPQQPHFGFLQIPPELVVEVVSLNEWGTDLNEKIEEYFALGVNWVWVVEPKRQAVRVYHSPTAVTLITDELHGEAILDGFVLSVPELFAEQNDANKHN